MVAVMDRLTHKLTWFEDVFDNTIVAQWREELDRDHFIASPRLMKGKTWDWCVQELRDKAVYYKEHQHIRQINSAKNGVEACVDAGVNAQPNMGLYAQANDHEPSWFATEKREEREEASHMTTGEQIEINNEQEFEDEHQAEDQNLALDQNTAYTLSYDEEMDKLTDVTADSDWDWKSQAWQPNKGSILNIAGSAHMISTLVDPLLFPLVYGKTDVLQHGGTVPLSNVLASYGATQTAPQPMAGETLQATCPWSRKYQSLPCEVAFDNDSGDSNNNKVKITSYINGLHSNHAGMYLAIERVLACVIQPWNDCLVRGDRDMVDRCNLGQLGPIPARIITYGMEWENELPDWATAFRIPTKGRKQEYFENQKILQRLPKDVRKRKWEDDGLAFEFADVINKEHRTLPPRDSDPWRRAREYLERPEQNLNTDETTCVNQVTMPPNDWVIGDERTWDLCEKTERLICYRHPEPGTAFNYEEWKMGRHNSRPIVDKAVPEPRQITERFRCPPFTPPHMRYLVALQDHFRDQGLQVLAETSSIELTPEAPAYAPHAAARAEVYAARTAKKIAMALSECKPIYPIRQPDKDGWQLSGQLNEHIAAVAVFVFDVVENITEPRLAFRQRTSLDYSLHRYDEFYQPPANASKDYNAWADGPAHMMGKG
ncbi:hypothetical protein CMQ_214 [Grosmannia clavigera kw1407]|uniref:Uncharacterized protein n=1 Tax=Grosmannia clavigera (strain kw1407 / UAMH 11150) TaxID=655863 RepID=F0XQS6_GROCL|nr:uncharacterized protein CMQ_214 [Grosmannia clavigera kw1407]EFW99896.1 hypothetical protein CMQ_214 [Grosmannia clavigera kw1407]